MMINYDEKHDVLYVAIGNKANSYGDDSDGDVIVMRDFDTDRITGFTISGIAQKIGLRAMAHGRNVTKKHPVDEFICSECGIVLVDYERLEIDKDDGDENCYEYEFRFCPNCGAKMDEREGAQ